MRGASFQAELSSTELMIPPQQTKLVKQNNSHGGSGSSIDSNNKLLPCTAAVSADAATAASSVEQRPPTSHGHLVGGTEFVESGGPDRTIIRRSKLKTTAWVHRGFTDDVTEVATSQPGGDLLTDFQKDKFRHFFAHVLDLNSDHVISAEDFDKLNDMCPNQSRGLVSPSMSGLTFGEHWWARPKKWMIFPCGCSTTQRSFLMSSTDQELG